MLRHVLLVLTSLGCGPSVMQVCDDQATAYCNVQFNCFPMAAAATYGTVAQCVAQRESPGIGACNSAQSICVSGTSYDTGAAETCISDLDKVGSADAGLCSNNTECLSCADISNGQTPPSCAPNLICH